MSFAENSKVKHCESELPYMVLQEELDGAEHAAYGAVPGEHAQPPAGQEVGAGEGRADQGHPARRPR